jgi:hypothetical protein
VPVRKDDDDDAEPAGGHSVISDSEAVCDPDEPPLVGVIVRVCTDSEPASVVVREVELLEPELETEPDPELVDDMPDLVTVRMLGTVGVAVADDAGSV